MDNSSKPSDEQTSQTRNQIEGLLWFVLFVLMLTVAGIVISRNWDGIKSSFSHVEIKNYNEVVVSDGFHHIQLENGQSWDISYETGHERNFAGLVRHVSIINEPAFAILSHDILVTNEDYSNPDLVQTSVTNHHFTWVANTPSSLKGTINLLHTVPMDQAISQQLDTIRKGNTVIITGYEIYRIEGYDTDGNYIGYWEDSGCNTTLVTNVEIIK